LLGMVDGAAEFGGAMPQHDWARRPVMMAAIRLFGMAAVVASAVMDPAVAASAASPSTFSFDVTDTFTDTSVCGFPVEVTNHTIGRTTQFSDVLEDGTGREVVHARAQDTWTANGTTLVGDWYRYTLTVTWVDFEPVAATASGVINKTRLPDGSIFMGAGRINLLTAVGYVVAPDHGVAKNQDAFCAALSA
jgi:hypothetical protein